MLVIDASNEYKEGKNQNVIEDSHIEKIVKAYDAATDIDKYMRVVSLAEIAENDYNLNISRYIDTSEPEPEINLTEVKEQLHTLKLEEAKIDAELENFLKELGL